MNEIKINGKQNFMGIEIPIVSGGFGSNKKCISDKTISEIHNMKVFHVRESINDNIKRFTDGVDYIDLKRIGDVDTLIQLGYSKQSITQAEHIYILSERGYGKLIKIFDTDLAWEIYDKMLDEYFAKREMTTDEKIQVLAQSSIETNKRIDEVKKDLEDFKMEMPLMAIDCETITKAKRKKIFDLLGGKDSRAYNNKTLRSKCYRDLERQMARDFGVGSYKAIHRNKIDKVVDFIENYTLPGCLSEEIRMMNNQMRLEDMECIKYM